MFFLCNEQPVGSLYVDQELIQDIEELEKGFSLSNGGWVEKGGAWKPQHCQANRKVKRTTFYASLWQKGPSLEMLDSHSQYTNLFIFRFEFQQHDVFMEISLFNLGGHHYPISQSL